MGLLRLELNRISGLRHWTLHTSRLAGTNSSKVHAVSTSQPSFYPVQALLAEPKVGVSITASSSHRDHSLVPVSLYPDHGGGPQAFSQWY